MRAALDGGVAGWILRAARALTTGNVGAGEERQLRVLETLTLAPKKQLLLVSCGEVRFLVGTGSEGVGAIVRLDCTRPEVR